MSAAPIVIRHGGIDVVRDDLFPGGTKARFIPALFADAEEVVYASPCEGGAQTALATVAAQLGKRATIFVAKRKEPHPRSLMAKRLGAKVMQVGAGYLSVVRARAQAYAVAKGAYLAPFGLDLPEAAAAIGAAAAQMDEPDEFWCASGSGVLYRALRRAWPNAAGNAVQVGRALSQADVPGARVWIAPLPFGRPCREAPPFPSDSHYDAKAWAIASRERGPGRVVFWNVTGDAKAAPLLGEPDLGGEGI